MSGFFFVCVEGGRGVLLFACPDANAPSNQHRLFDIVAGFWRAFLAGDHHAGYQGMPGEGGVCVLAVRYTLLWTRLWAMARGVDRANNRDQGKPREQSNRARARKKPLSTSRFGD